MKRKSWLYLLFSLVAVQVVAWSLLSSNTRKRVQRVWGKPMQSRLLSSIANDIDGQGNYIKALKFKTRDGIQLEFIQVNPDGTKRVLPSKEIKHPYNGFFEYRGESVHLAIGDIDGDGVMELMAPTFDKDLTPHLNVYYYDRNHNNFYRTQSL